ncbi:MAG: hypothetical protein LUG18_10515 [Candidatus Azobacteroides sp.]|nr:hypothetical protein [Candidatus Azobacteroides sp.]
MKIPFLISFCILLFLIDASYIFSSGGNKRFFLSSEAEKVFPHLKTFPVISDTATFVRDLLRISCEDSDSSLFIKKGEISVYQKIKVYGSDHRFFMIEYDYKSGSEMVYPWKSQFILSEEGHLIQKTNALRFGFIDIFPNENPFLFLLFSTSKGNGWHEICKITANGLENVYEGCDKEVIQTYDAHQDHAIYEPYELMVEIKDFNKDGYNDIAFRGEMIFLWGQSENGGWYNSELINGEWIEYSVNNPFKKLPVEMIFLYEPSSGHFKAKENYTDKYSFYF